MPDKPDIKLGDVWQVDGMHYRVVGPLRDGVWPLQGPLPTRAMAQGSTEDLHAGTLVRRSTDLR